MKKMEPRDDEPWDVMVWIDGPERDPELPPPAAQAWYFRQVPTSLGEMKLDDLRPWTAPRRTRNKRNLHGQIRVPDAPKPTFSDQTVEITLGPKGAFENGNVGTLTRRLNVDLVVSATPKPCPSKPKPPSPNPTARAVEALRNRRRITRLFTARHAVNNLPLR